jgi:tetratricopeptide (TPR) repeat protein
MTTSEQHRSALADHPVEIAGFTVTRLLGRGGSATVWAARGSDAQAREVAIKLYEDHDQRHHREREALRLVGPGVAPAVLAHGRHGARPYLVMEQIRGPTLVEIIAAHPPPAVVAGHVAALARALDAIHAAGVVHRDLKPGHVFLAGDSVTVIDFGLACFPDARRDRGAGQHPDTLELTREDERIGTPWYMAPEQCRGEAGDARTDIYALGIIAFELLTGRRPFDGDAAAVRAAQVSHRPPAASSWAALPVAVDAVLRRCLAKEQSLRHQRAGELADDLARALAGHLPENSLALSAAPAVPVAPAARTARIALLSVPFPGSTLALTSALEPGECVVRVTGPRYLIAVHEPTAPAAGVHAAVRAAARLGARLSLPVEAAIVVHSAVVRLRQSARGVQVRGPDLDLPALVPPPAITGLVLTRVAAGALAPGASQPLDQDYAVLRAGAEAATVAVALVGRDRVLAELTSDRGADDICTIIGDVGLGKTRLLAELAVRRHADGDQIIALDAGASEPLLGQLIGACTRSLGHLAGAVRASLITGGQREVLEAALGVEGGDAGRPVPARGLHARAPEAAAALITGLAEQTGHVSVLVDDAHHADPIVLDALEQAVARSRSVWVCAAGLPALAASRPGWVADAPGRRCVELTPLALDDARTLLRALMAPAEFIPEAVIDRLADAAAGVPLYLVEQVHALRTGGSMRAHAATADLFVAADELAHVSTTPLARRLAASLLAPLSPILRRCAALAAVCGDQVGASELDELQRALGGDWLDAGVALARLAEAGVLTAEAGERYRFRHSLLRQAIEAGEPAEVAAWHRAALALLPAPENADLPALHRIARHARACGDRDMAWSAWFALAEHARARHAYVEAEQHYSIALEQIAPEAHACPPDPALPALPADQAARRRRTLAGRGHARYRIQRFTDALDDIRAARACAEVAGDTGPLVRLLLEEATLLDWIYDIEASTACARRARALAADAAPVDAALDSRSLSARLLAAEGRSAYRHEQFPEAIDLLGRAAAEAAAHADDEARVIALLLLAPSLLYADRLAEAETCYAEVVGLCEQIGDTFHLAAAHTNRQFLWMRLGRMDRAEADLTRAIRLARTLGNALVERIASHNLGELLYWSGRAGEALTHARRSAHLQRRFPDAHHVPDDSLLVARVLVALARMDEARALLAEVLRRWPVADMTPTARMLAELLTLQLETAPEARWRAAAARHLDGIDVVDFALELHHAAATAALARGAEDEARAWLATASALGHRSPLWSARLDALAARLGVSR